MTTIGRTAPLGIRLFAIAGVVVLPVLARAELPVETLTVAPPISAKNRAYVGDIAINHIADGKLHVVDTDTGAYLGVIGSGFAGQYTFSPDKSEVIIATTYLSRGQRGDRTDIVEVWDANSLSFKYEIPIPDKRAMALNYRGMVRTSADGRWLFVQNATPATSVTVVDMQAKQQAAEIPTPGCWGIFPVQSRSDRFSTVCGDGTIATVVLDDGGNAASQSVSEKLFDPDKDAWFIQGEQDGDTYRFVSFLGNISLVDLSGDTATLTESWSMVRSAADRKKAWRPGGYQPLAVHAGAGRLFVTMHSNGAEGSHKNPAEEIWVFDLKTKKRLARLPGHAAIALTASTDGKRVYAIDIMKLSLVVMDATGTGRVRHVTAVGDIPVQVEAF
jgi:methylamine dehydrogenase heavy chain